MEGPSLKLASEQLQPFVGQQVLEVRGNAKIDMGRCDGQVVRSVFSFGKQLLIQFDTFALRTHFMLFGTYEATVDGVTQTGDYLRAHEPRLALRFSNGELRLFSCSVRYLEGAKVKRDYDMSKDVLSRAWDPAKALIALSHQGKQQIADVLLDQDIFAGVGNMIKNEVLSLVRIRPDALVKNLPIAKRTEIITQTRTFSQQFLRWKRQFELVENLKVHQKKQCPYCGGALLHERTGAKQRMSHYCPICQRKTAR